MKSEVYKEKVNTRDELVSCIMNSAALIKQEHQNDLRIATRTLPRGLKSALKLMVGFSNTMRNIQTAASPHPLKIGHMFI